jgi:hypothetical protein
MVEYMTTEQIPKCPCGDLCDRIDGMGEWYHSRCQQEKADGNAKRTRRVLGLRSEILRREGRE